MTIGVEPPVEFAVECDDADGRLVLRLRGDLDSESSARLRATIEALTVEGDAELDLTGLTFIDSTGLGCLLRLQQQVADAGGLLIARGACPPVRRAIEMVQLNRVMALLD